LIVFDLKLADVPFELAQLFVNGRHAWRKPPNLHARSTSELRQPEGGAETRIRHRSTPFLFPIHGLAAGIARRSALC
jgi:hypothetical protein